MGMEICCLFRTVVRLRENTTALLGMIKSKNNLIDELNEQVESYEEDSVRRRKAVASLREVRMQERVDVNAAEALVKHSGGAKGLS